MNYLFLDNGFEEIEALTTVDLLRRADIKVTTVSVTGNPMVLGAHDIAVQADCCIEDVDFSDAETLILPGGATKLDQCSALCDLLRWHDAEGKLIAAICAAPAVLGNSACSMANKLPAIPDLRNILVKAMWVDLL